MGPDPGGAKPRQLGQYHSSGIFLRCMLAHLRWTQVRQAEHSIMGRPAKGLRQKQVTLFQPSSSAASISSFVFVSSVSGWGPPLGGDSCP